MRCKIEYLTETADEESVCLATFSDGTLQDAVARADACRPVVEHEVEGYQIRDLQDGGRVVSLKAFDR